MPACCPDHGHFNSHAPRGARRILGRDSLPNIIFQLTRPSRGATQRPVKDAGHKIISTHTPLAGRDRRDVNRRQKQIEISTHTPLAGRDEHKQKCSKLLHSISTHTPLAGRDLMLPKRSPAGIRSFQLTRPSRGATARGSRTKRDCRLFQLTRPSRGATVRKVSSYRDDTDFNSHAPRGARRSKRARERRTEPFQLTRPSRGATASCKLAGVVCAFQLTRPSRGATREPHALRRDQRRISTHTPLAGRDVCRYWRYRKTDNFNSHAPRGARRICSVSFSV